MNSSIRFRLISASSVFFILTLAPLEWVSAQTEISFTSEQVDSGKLLYRDHCQICHGSTLSNGQFGTPLRGSFFRNNMSGKSLGELLQFTYESMPPDNPMLLEPQQYSEIIAFILERNRLQVSDTEMSGNYESLNTVMLPW